MKDLTCPYCEYEFDDPDFFDNEASEAYELECPNCAKIMLCQYEVSPSFDTWGAPCKNGGDHKLKKIRGFPNEYYKYKRRCEYCHEIFIIDEEKNREEIRKII